MSFDLPTHIRKLQARFLRSSGLKRRNGRIVRIPRAETRPTPSVREQRDAKVRYTPLVDEPATELYEADSYYARFYKYVPLDWRSL